MASQYTTTNLYVLVEFNSPLNSLDDTKSTSIEDFMEKTEFLPSLQEEELGSSLAMKDIILVSSLALFIHSTYYLCS